MNAVDMHIIETLFRRSLKEFLELVENLHKLGAPPGLLIQFTCAGTSTASNSEEKARELAWDILNWGTEEWNLGAEAVARIFNGKSTVLQEQKTRSGGVYLIHTGPDPIWKENP